MLETHLQKQLGFLISLFNFSPSITNNNIAFISNSGISC